MTNIIAGIAASVASAFRPAEVAVGEGSIPPVAPSRWIGSELVARIMSAAILAAIALLATYQGGWPFALLWLLGGIAVLAEWIAMAGVKPRLPLQVGLGLGLVALAALHLGGAGAQAWLLAGALAVALGLALGRRSRDRLWAMAGFLYAMVIVLVPPLVRDDPRLGLSAVLWMFAVVWTTDVVAYFSGRGLGGPKLWPAVSPKKTWSGFVGGLVGGTVAGLLVAVGATRLGWEAPATLGPIAVVSAGASVASQLGDLGESALKRAFEVKDSSRLIPGHGGAMDRLDGFWAVAALVGLVLLGSRIPGG